MNSTSLLLHPKYVPCKNKTCWNMSYKRHKNHCSDYILHRISLHLWIDKYYENELDDDSSEIKFIKNKLTKIDETSGFMKFLPKTIRIKSKRIRNRLIRKLFTESKQPCISYTMLTTDRRSSTYKSEFYRYILIAKPDHVCFHNFQKNVLYRKTIILTNISIYSTKFQIHPISHHSKFIVTIQNKKLEKNFIAPGMQLKLIISFYTEDLYEEEEIVTIYVQHGRPINIKLQCTRDPPTLKRIIIPHLQYAKAQINNCYVTEDTTSSNSCKSCITEYSSTIKEFNKYYSKKKSLMNTVNSDMIFECGKCFVGEQVALQIRFKNIGADGKFIVISEIDWYSMCIEDITDMNILTLQYFAVWPAYFVLKTQEDIFINTYFFPDSYGVHVDTLYIVTDNYSVKSFELIGDGIMYEPETFKINSQSEKMYLFLTKIDTKSVAHYDLNIQRNPLKEFEVVTRNISITNTSQMYMFFHWEKVKVSQENEMKNEMENEMEVENDDEDFMDYFYIIPESGIIFASAVLNFNIVITIPSINLPDGHIYGLLQLYVEDIPQAAISKAHKLWTTESQTKRRICTTNSVDILVADIKLIQTLYYDTSFKKKSDESVDISYDKDILEIDISQTAMKKEWSDVDLDIYGNQKCTLMPALMLEELFSSLDIIDIETIKSLICEPIISHGVLRPFRLFIGIQEMFTVNIKNVTTTSVSYSWGNPIGSDCLKLKLIFCCESDCIPAGVTKSIQIICCPIEEGYVESLYIPCYIRYSQQIIFLQIECEIKSFYVTFHIPYSDDILKTSDICFEWHTSSISVRPNLLALQNSMLNKIISAKNDIISNSKKYSFESFEINQNIYYEQTGEDYEEEEFNQLVPFYKTVSICHPVTIEFLKVPLGVATKKTFLIKNETTIKSSFLLKVNNFYPVYITEKGKIKKDMIQSIYKMITGHYTGDIWNEIKQPNSGILIYVNPFITELAPYKDVLVDIYVFVDTWGIYTDELEINILGLPPYILSICVQVTETPISFPICEKTRLKTPVCRFGILSASSEKEVRKVFMKNNSSIPLIIHWQIVSIENLSESYPMPFKVILHMRTHFTNNLAMALRKLKDKNENEKLPRNRLEVYLHENNCQMLNDSPCITSADSNSNYESDIFEYEMCSSIFDDQYINNDSQINKSGTTEFQVDLITNNFIDSNICMINPDEIFIPPKGKTCVEIKIFPNKCPLYKDRYKISCNALGSIQIAPMDKYKRRHYCRNNILLTPIMIQIEAQIVSSRLTYDIPKFDRLFTFYADDVMKSSDHIMKITKSYVFYNKGESQIFAKFEISNPFTIDYIQDHCKINKYNEKGIYIDGWNFIEIRVACSVDAMLIEEIIETKKDTISHYKPGFSKHTNNWFSKGQLRVIYTDHSSQVLKLLLNIYLPLLRVPPCLNFGNVCIGEEKKFILDVENLSAYKCKIKVKKTKFNEDFNYNPDTGEILACPVNGKHTLPITVCFSPRNIGQSIEILKIMSTVPNYEEKCVLCGEGVPDEDCQKGEAQ